MAVAVTNAKLLLFNTGYEVASNAATADTADLAEVFTITPTRKPSRIAVIINEVSEGGALAVSVAAGGLWAAGSALSESVASGKSEAIVLETAKYLSTSGTILITLTPASGKKLKTDHGATMQVIELP